MPAVASPGHGARRHEVAQWLRDSQSFVSGVSGAALPRVICGRPNALKTDESGRRISPSVDLRMVADSVDFANISLIPGFSALNRIEGNGGRSVALIGIWGKGGT